MLKISSIHTSLHVLTFNYAFVTKQKNVDVAMLFIYLFLCSDVSTSSNACICREKQTQRCNIPVQIPNYVAIIYAEVLHIVAIGREQQNMYVTARRTQSKPSSFQVTATSQRHPCHLRVYSTLSEWG